jgi:transcription elongation factor Elf1
MKYDTTCTIFPTCPYCGIKMTNPLDIDFTVEPTTIICDGCDKEYMVTKVITIDYTTYKI